MRNQSPKNINEYINKQPENIQKLLQNIRQSIQNTVPEATETISYGMPTYDLNGRHLIYFSAWKDHIGLYPMYENNRASNGVFSKYRKTKNSLHIPYTEPFPYQIIEKFALHRMTEENKL